MIGFHYQADTRPTSPQPAREPIGFRYPQATRQDTESHPDDVLHVPCSGCHMLAAYCLCDLLGSIVNG
jgi:hypothetical protein